MGRVQLLSEVQAICPSCHLLHELVAVRSCGAHRAAVPASRYQLGFVSTGRSLDHWALLIQVTSMLDATHMPRAPMLQP